MQSRTKSHGLSHGEANSAFTIQNNTSGSNKCYRTYQRYNSTFWTDLLRSTEPQELPNLSTHHGESLAQKWPDHFAHAFLSRRIARPDAPPKIDDACLWVLLPYANMTKNKCKFPIQGRLIFLTTVQHYKQIMITRAIESSRRRGWI